MRSSRATLSLGLLALLLSCGPRGASAPAASAREPGTTRVLFLTGGGYHDFAQNAAALKSGLSAWPGLHVRLLPIDEDGKASHLISDTTLLTEQTDVILAYTQGAVTLSPAARDELLVAIRGGVGFVGLHCAADSHPGWAAYDEMLGARFERHPPLGEVSVRVDDAAHPVTAGLPAEWTLTDEFYHLKGFSPAGKDVLMSGISPEGGERRPVAWAKTFGAGRVVYTILGHGLSTHGDPRYQRLVAQALEWAGAPRPADGASR